jgi:hypothetical protein
MKLLTIIKTALLIAVISLFYFTACDNGTSVATKPCESGNTADVVFKNESTINDYDIYIDNVFMETLIKSKSVVHTLTAGVTYSISFKIGTVAKCTVSKKPDKCTSTEVSCSVN